MPTAVIKLGLPALAYRSVDMTHVFKLLHGHDYINDLNTNWLTKVEELEVTLLYFLNPDVEQGHENINSLFSNT